MTSMSVHPAAEDLGRFIEGTLDDAERTAMIEHIADCDECRIVVVDGAAFGEESAAAPQTLWWLPVAAAIALIVASVLFVRHERRDPVAELVNAYSGLRARPIEGRLSGFPYLPGASRGPRVNDTATLMLEGTAASIEKRHGTDAEVVHAHGLAHLLTGDVETAVVELSESAGAEPSNANYWNDLAAAQLEARNPAAALSAADRALSLVPAHQEALFNRAQALEALGQRTRARQAYDRYLSNDRASPWAAEAQRGRHRLDP